MLNVILQDLSRRQTMLRENFVTLVDGGSQVAKVFRTIRHRGEKVGFAWTKNITFGVVTNHHHATKSTLFLCSNGPDDGPIYVNLIPTNSWKIYNHTAFQNIKFGSDGRIGKISEVINGWVVQFRFLCFPRRSFDGEVGRGGAGERLTRLVDFALSLPSFVV